MCGRPQSKDFPCVKIKLRSNELKKCSEEARLLIANGLFLSLMALSYSAHVKGAFKEVFLGNR